MLEHTIAVAPDEFELMLTAFAAHRLPILNRMCCPKLRGEFAKQMSFSSYPVECRIGSERHLLQYHPLRSEHEMQHLSCSHRPIVSRNRLPTSGTAPFGSESSIIMTSGLVALMEKNKLKRLPVMRGETLVGIVSRSNLLQAVASLARQIPDPTADDDHTRNQCARQERLGTVLHRTEDEELANAS